MPKFSMGRRQFALGAAAAATSLVLPGNALPGNALPGNALPGNALPGNALPANALAGNALPGDLLAQAAPGAEKSLDEKTRAAMAKLSPSAQAEVEMKVASIFRKYGDRLSDEQKADTRRVMAESQEGLEKMRAFRLENSDQPADSFRAWHRVEKPAEEKRRRRVEIK